MGTGWVYPMTIIAAISVIAFSVIGISAMTDRSPAMQSRAEVDHDVAAPPATGSEQARVAQDSCGSCAVVEFIGVRMEDGTRRNVYARSQLQVSVGDRIKLSNGNIAKLTGSTIVASRDAAH